MKTTKALAVFHFPCCRKFETHIWKGLRKLEMRGHTARGNNDDRNVEGSFTPGKINWQRGIENVVLLNMAGRKNTYFFKRKSFDQDYYDCKKRSLRKILRKNTRSYLVKKHNFVCACWSVEIKIWWKSQLKFIQPLQSLTKLCGNTIKLTQKISTQS